jgi:hypothetical protein
MGRLEDRILRRVDRQCPRWLRVLGIGFYSVCAILAIKSEIAAREMTKGNLVPVAMFFVFVLWAGFIIVRLLAPSNLRLKRFEVLFGASAAVAIAIVSSVVGLVGLLAGSATLAILGAIQAALLAWIGIAHLRAARSLGTKAN